MELRQQKILCSLVDNLSSIRNTEHKNWVRRLQYLKSHNSTLVLTKEQRTKLIDLKNRYLTIK